jgi:CHAT domain-containing protein
MDLAILSRALLPPGIASAFEQHRVKSLLVVPIEEIGGVPFAALPVRDSSTLIDYASVEVAPGFRALQELAGSNSTISAKDQMLIVGDPDLVNNPVWIFPPLSGARLEAEQVAKMFGKRALIGKEATRQAVVRDLTIRPTPKLIYFATHAISDQLNPQDDSFLALTGANLRTREIGKLKLTGHPLVVLSACQTGLGKVFDQGGIFGMALAWDYAGAGAVVMSLWNVPDLPTRDLMLEFSDRLSQGELPAQALADSMRTVRQHDPDPRNWAGFTVFGGLPLRPQSAQEKTALKIPQRTSSERTQVGRTK